MKEEEMSFSPSTIATIARVDKSTLSRKILKISDLKSEDNSNKRRKYNFAETRLILENIKTIKHDIKNKIQVFFNFKGGTGKTSLCYQVASHLALMGYHVLAIDCDPQAHLSYALGFDENKDFRTLYDVLINKLRINDVICKDIYPGLDCIPSNLSLTRLELPLSQQVNRERVLGKVLEPLKSEYDFILIDTNPTISTVNQNATLAADILNIVCETQPFSLKGLELLIGEIDTLSKGMEQEINYVIIPNKYDAKTATSQEALGTLRYDYKDQVLESIVRRCEDINISAKMKLPVCAISSKNSAAFEDIIDLVYEIIKKSS